MRTWQTMCLMGSAFFLGRATVYLIDNPAPRAALATPSATPAPTPIRGHGYALTVEYGGNAYVEDSGLTLEDCARDAVPMAKAKPYAEVLCVPIRTESDK